MGFVTMAKGLEESSVEQWETSSSVAPLARASTGPSARASTGPVQPNRRRPPHNVTGDSTHSRIDLGHAAAKRVCDCGCDAYATKMMDKCYSLLVDGC